MEAAGDSRTCRLELLEGPVKDRSKVPERRPRTTLAEERAGGARLRVTRL